MRRQARGEDLGPVLELGTERGVPRFVDSPHHRSADECRDSEDDAHDLQADRDAEQKTDGSVTNRPESHGSSTASAILATTS
jgi:hypothetical protein